MLSVQGLLPLRPLLAAMNNQMFITPRIKRLSFGCTCSLPLALLSPRQRLSPIIGNNMKPLLRMIVIFLLIKLHLNGKRVYTLL